MIYIPNSNKKCLGFVLLFFVQAVFVEIVDCGTMPPMMPNFGGMPGGGFGGGGMGGFGGGGDPMAGLEDLFKDPGAMEQMMREAQEMMKDPEFMRQMDEMTRQMGLPGGNAMDVPWQPPASNSPSKGADEGLYGYPTEKATSKPKSKPEPEEKEEKDDEAALKAYSGYQRVLMSNKSSSGEKNKAFTEFSVIFNQYYEKIKGYVLLTDDTEPHLLAPMREEFGKLVYGELCQASAAIITISENFSDKAFAGSSKDSKKLYKQLFKVLDIAKEIFEKLEKFAQMHDPSTKKDKKSIDVSDLQPEEVQFIDGSGKNSIAGLAEQITANLKESTKLLENSKLKDLYQKHMEQKGYKPYQKPYKSSYGKSSYGNKSDYGKYGGGSSSRGKSGGGYGGGYRDYDNYKQGYYDDYKDPIGTTPNAKLDDQNGFSSPASKNETKTKEPNKEATEAYLAIVGLADLKLFQEGQKAPQPEPLYKAVSEVVQKICKTKTIAVDLETFLYQIFDFQPKTKSKEVVAGAKEKLDPQVAQGYKDKFAIFDSGLKVLELVALEQLPYSKDVIPFCHGTIDTATHKDVIEKAVRTSMGVDAKGAVAGPFAIPTADAKEAEAPHKEVQKFIGAVRAATGEAKAMQEVLASWRKTTNDIFAQTKVEQLINSIGQEISSLHSKVASATKNGIGQVGRDVAVIKSYGTTLATPKLKEEFFKGIAVVAAANPNTSDWPLFKAFEGIQRSLLALSELVIKYKVEFPQRSFVQLDPLIEQSLNGVAKTVADFVKAFEALGTIDLKEPVRPAPGGAAPARVVSVGPNNFLVKPGGGLAGDAEYRDCTREFLIAIAGSGEKESKAAGNQMLTAYQTLGLAIKTVAVLHDNVRSIATGEEPGDQLHKSCIKSAVDALKVTVIDKTSFTEAVGKAQDYIKAAVGSVANLVAGFFN